MSGLASSAAQAPAAAIRADRAATREVERKRRKVDPNSASPESRAEDEVMVAAESVERIEAARSLKDNAQEESHEDRQASYNASGQVSPEQGGRIDVSG